MKKKFNFIDVLVVLLVVVVVVGAVWYFTKDDGTGTETASTSNKVEVTFVAEADRIQNGLLDQLRVGDKIMSNEMLQDGEIVDFEIMKTDLIEAVDGEIVAIEMEELNKVRVTIKCMANKYGPYMDIGGQEIKVGSRYYIKTDIFEAFGYVAQIVEVKE